MTRYPRFVIVPAVLIGLVLCLPVQAQREPTAEQRPEWYAASSVTALPCQTCPASVGHYAF